MGFTGGEAVPTPEGPRACEDQPVWMGEVRCMGHELHLTECSHESTSLSCDHHADVMLRCFNDSAPGLIIILCFGRYLSQQRAYVPFSNLILSGANQRYVYM